MNAIDYNMAPLGTAINIVGGNAIINVKATGSASTAESNAGN
jgi:hypothetical protein